ncbi:MAG: 2-hydroxyacyl-CoA dehydratase family protein [Deltaproteobacteria bacterium]|jgi:benzoyl-CoA reductase/2-hydroxyglutaryl-CoA dehydratase subunit BcrC/BadD/HgdB|nr:2-hydroxyacyl-CoA dehydratase family protein [Deltaproteobacteria bacterium]
MNSDTALAKEDDPESISGQKAYIEYSKNVHAHSPAVQRLLDLSEDYVPGAERAFIQKGKPAVWCSGYNWEPAFLYSLGITPVSYGEMGRYSTREDMLVAEDFYQFPVETCSMVKCTVGQWHKRRNKGTINRILGSSSNCEPFNLAWEVMREQGYDVFNNEVIYRGPTVTGERLEQLIMFTVGQMKDAAFWLTGSREIDEGRLKTEIARKNRLLGKLKAVLELRRSHPFYMKTLAVILTLNVGLNNYFGKPEDYEEAVDELLGELRAAKVSERDLRDVIPLVWAGGTGQEFGVYESIDLAGGALLGLRSVPFRFYREDVPPLESLARWVYDNSSAGAGVYARNVLESEVERLGAKGVILYGYIGCSFASIDREMWRRYFHEKGLPCLNLEGSFQTGSPSGQVLTRVRAFVEMLAAGRARPAVKIPPARSA